MYVYPTKVCINGVIQHCPRAGLAIFYPCFACVRCRTMDLAVITNLTSIMTRFVNEIFGKLENSSFDVSAQGEPVKFLDETYVANTREMGLL